MALRCAREAVQKNIAVLLFCLVITKNNDFFPGVCLHASDYGIQTHINIGFLVLCG